VLRADHELALHGHTHLHRFEQRNGLTIYTPGKCAGHMTGYNTIGVVDLETRGLPSCRRPLSGREHGRVQSSSTSSVSPPGGW
jgi:hypothetical protein